MPDTKLLPGIPAVNADVTIGSGDGFFPKVEELSTADQTSVIGDGTTQRPLHSSGGGGSGVFVDKDGVPVVTPALTLNLIGLGVSTVTDAGGGQADVTIPGVFFPDSVLGIDANLPAGQTNDWTPTDWATKIRHYVGGDAGAGSIVSGLAALPVGTVRFLEFGAASHGPITFLNYSDPAAVGSLGANRIVTPAQASVRVDPGGEVALIYIGGGPLHGWRVMFHDANNILELGAGHLRMLNELAVTIGAGPINDYNPPGFLTATRIKITVPSTGAILTGMQANNTSITGTGDGEIKILENAGDGAATITATLTLGHLGSTGANSFYPDKEIILPVGGVAIYMFDGVSWRLIGSSRPSNRILGPELVTAPLAAGDNNDWFPTGFHAFERIRVSPNAAGSTLTGIDAGEDGEVHTLICDYFGGAAQLLTLAEYRTSTPANRFVCPGIADITLLRAGVVTIMYDTTVGAWRVLSFI